MCWGREEGFAGRTRVEMPCLPAKQRMGFDEVELGLDEQAALAEGGRCFQCGVRLQISPAPLPTVGTENKNKKLKKLGAAV